MLLLLLQFGSQAPHEKEKVDKLVCFCGIETLSALVIVSKVGDFNRFTKAYHFSNYIRRISLSPVFVIPRCFSF